MGAACTDRTRHFLFQHIYVKSPFNNFLTLQAFRFLFFLPQIDAKPCTV